MRPPPRRAATFPPAVARTVSDPRTTIFKGTVTRSRRDGPWLRERFHESNGIQGVSWRRSSGGATWLLAGVAARQTFALVARTFDDVHASWTQQLTAPQPSAPTEPRYTSSDQVLEYAGLAWLALAIAAVALLAYVRRRMVTDWVAAALSFVAVAGFYFALVELPTIGYTLFHASSRASWPQLSLLGLEQLVAMLTLVVLLTRTGRRVAAELIGLNLGLFAIHWIDRAISAGVSAGRLSIVAAVLVLLALLWEVVMSGEPITNRHAAGFPRHARVLVYFGYTIGVAAALTFFSSIGTAGGVSEPLFESENFSDTGLLFLGTALVVTLFGLRARRALTLPETRSPTSD